MAESKVTCPACNRTVGLNALGAQNLKNQRVMEWHLGGDAKEWPGSSHSVEAMLRRVPNRDCPSCGRRDGNWTAEQKPEVEVRLNRLAINQMVGSAHPDSGHILYTHNCNQK